MRMDMKRQWLETLKQRKSLGKGSVRIRKRLALFSSEPSLSRISNMRLTLKVWRTMLAPFYKKPKRGSRPCVVVVRNPRRSGRSRATARTRTIPRAKTQLGQVRQRLRRLGRIQILMQVVRLIVVRGVERGRKLLVSALKSRLATNIPRLIGRHQLIAEKPSKMNLAE